MATTMTAQVYQLKFKTDANGEFILDAEKLQKFYQQQVRVAVNMNKKIAAMHEKGNGSKFKILDPHESAMVMVRMYQHQFRAYDRILIS